MKHVLLLGAGHVAEPAVGYLAAQGLRLTIASDDPARHPALLARAASPTAHAIVWSAGDDPTLRTLIGDADAVVSLLPPSFHASVAKACIDARTSLVTASYVSPEMRALDRMACDAGVTLLNEMGLDPGIDHMAAMRLIDRLRREGATVTSFRSHCGGLPAPDADDNPWHYKMSWSPLGVLRAARASARHLRDTVEVEVPADALFAEPQRVLVPTLGELETYPNRNALIYQTLYGLQRAQTLYRGTLRYPGWCATLRALQQLDLLTDDPPSHDRWAALLAARLGGATKPPLERRIADALECPADDPVLERLRWLGLLSNEPLPQEGASVIEALGALMAKRLAYEPGQRDVIVLRHDIEATAAEGTAVRHATSRLLQLGVSGGDSAMATTVGLTAAIGARLVVERRYVRPGVQIPVTADLYEPLLAELEQQGVIVEEELEGWRGAR